jgi:hypothetical protein
MLVYFGKLNPPHHGHLATLENGFHTAGTDLGLVAAAVVRRGPRSHQLGLTKRERAESWRGAEGNRGSFYWVFEGSSDVWNKFEDALQEDIRQHGFHFEWVLLVGSPIMYLLTVGMVTAGSSQLTLGELLILWETVEH